MATDTETLGQRIVRFRTDLGMSRAKFAKASGVSERQLGNIERGVALSPHPDTLGAIAKALNMSIPELRGSVVGAEDRILAAIEDLRAELSRERG